MQQILIRKRSALKRHQFICNTQPTKSWHFGLLVCFYIMEHSRTPVIFKAPTKSWHFKFLYIMEHSRTPVIFKAPTKSWHFKWIYIMEHSRTLGIFSVYLNVGEQTIYLVIMMVPIIFICLFVYPKQIHTKFILFNAQKLQIL